MPHSPSPPEPPIPDTQPDTADCAVDTTSRSSATAESQQALPMLDIHVPDHSTRTWRDFLIHIATIVIGLLIAIGLEQLVEYVHHRHQLYEARAAIHAEMEVNTRLLDRILAATQAAETDMQRNASMLLATSPADTTPTSALHYLWQIPYPQSNAWQDAKASGAVNFMAPGERAAADYIYGDGDLAERFAMAWLTSNNAAAAIARSAPTLNALTADDRAELLKLTRQTEGQIESYRMLISFDRESIQHYLSYPEQSGLQTRD
ncbi:MAG: hypothetical protein KGI42_05645 [Xanthomonadaceae bacterium]|nr:hypothetical protein [Xanthomonadaceae bacterium]